MSITLRDLPAGRMITLPKPARFKARYTRSEWANVASLLNGMRSYGVVDQAFTAARTRLQETARVITSGLGRKTFLQGVFGPLLWIEKRRDQLQRQVDFRIRWKCDQPGHSTRDIVDFTVEEAQEIADLVVTPFLAKLDQDAAIICQPNLYAPGVDPDRLIGELLSVDNSGVLIKEILRSLYHVHPHYDRNHRETDPLSAKGILARAMLPSQAIAALRQESNQTHVAISQREVDIATACNLVYRALYLYAHKHPDLPLQGIPRLLRTIPGMGPVIRERDGWCISMGGLRLDYGSGSLAESLRRIAQYGNNLADPQKILSLSALFRHPPATISTRGDRLVFTVPFLDTLRAHLAHHRDPWENTPIYRTITGLGYDPAFADLARACTVESGCPASLNPLKDWWQVQTRDAADDDRDLEALVRDVAQDQLAELAWLYDDALDFAAHVQDDMNDVLVSTSPWSLPELCSIWETTCVRPDLRETRSEQLRGRGLIRPQLRTHHLTEVA